MEGSERRLRRVVVVFKTHFDLGFTDLPDRVMSLYTGPMFDAVREVMAATAGEPEGLRYNWTLPSWPLKQLLHDPALPQEAQDAARRLVEAGRLHWHVWPFTTHTAFCGLEDMVRGLHISRSLSEEYGRWPSGAKQTDVPGHTWILPSMLVRAGVKFLHLGCNPGSHPPHVPRLFWWEGPDGARLLTYYSPGGYGTPLLPPDDWELDTWLAVQQTLENHGPHSPEDLRRMRDYVAEHAPGVEVVFGELGDFAEALLARPEQLAGLPVVPYDLADTWIHGVGTMPREVARVRELRGKLLALEMLAATLEWPQEQQQGEDFPLARKVAPHIDQAYEALMLFSEHTWGLDVKITIKRVFGESFWKARETEPYQRLEASWKAKVAYVDRAEAAFDKALEVLLEAGHEVYTVMKTSAPTNSSPVGLARRLKSRATNTKSPYGDYATTLYSIVRAGGLRLRSPRIYSPGEALHIEDSQQNVIENDYLRVEVDPLSGGITSLVDKRTSRDWVDKTSSEPFGGYRYDIYSASDIAEFMRSYGQFFQPWFVQDFGKESYPEDTAHITAYARDFQVRKSQGPSVQVLHLTDGRIMPSNVGCTELPGQMIDITFSLAGNSSYLDIEYSIRGKEATPLAESTVVPFPLNLPKPSFRLGQVGSVIDLARDIAEGANRSLWCVDGWIDASDDRVGMSVMPIDMPLVSIGNTGIYRFEPERVPREPVIYAHLSNTQWGTNFPQWLEGDFNFRIRLMPHVGDWRQGRVWTYEHGSKGDSFPLANEIAQLPIVVPDDVRLLGVRPRHDGQGMVVRLWDRLGIQRHVEVKIGGLIDAVWRCDLMERPVERVEIYGIDDNDADEGIRAVFEIRPHAIETLLIEFTQDGGGAE
ncbi:MAG TPA: glycoside hydrolase family 38 C-terminal domain-containing protein [Chloroflexia bacterium]|nr:glycoside hydrolase family 38 C-terminal domain-containing protein [Chloroflexia bacterium]